MLGPLVGSLIKSQLLCDWCDVSGFCRAVTEIQRIVISGQAALKRGKDGFANGAAMLEDVSVPEAQDRIALSLHELVAGLVFSAAGMLRAIDLDNELCLAASEVGEIGTYWELPGEVMA